MPDPARAPAPPRRRFGPASLRQWGEAVGLAASLAGAGGLAYFGDELTGWQRVAGWSLFGLALAYLLRAGWVRLFGPVLFYDLVRTARRARTYVTRCAYLVLLLFFLWSVVGSQMERHAYRPSGDPERVKEMAALAEAFFGTFMGVQFGLALFLTPAYVASAVTEEKERKTLEFLLATDLDSREIVLGKLVARVGQLTLLLLAGLPVLSAVQFLGGVDPDLVLAGFAATALTVAGLAGVSILASVHARRSRDAILLAYLAAGLYVALCFLGTFLIETRYFSGIDLIPGVLTPDDCIRAFQAGNPGYALYRVFSATAGPVREAIPGTLRDYAIFYALVTGVTVTLAVRRLRPVALREAGGRTGDAKDRRRAAKPVGDRPMVWKEMHHGGRSRPRWRARLMVGAFVALSFLPAAFMLFDYGWFGGPRRSYTDLAGAFNTYVRVVATAVACLACLLGAAVRGSVAVRVERDKDTLDALLTSPLGSREILFGKWVGCLWGLRWPATWLGCVYLLGLLTGGLSLFAVPPLAAAVFVYCGTLAAVGLWFSVVCRTTVRATVAAVFTALGLSVGHLLLWVCCVPFGGFGGGGEAIFKFQLGVMPPAVLGGILPFDAVRSDFMDPHEQGEMLAYALVGTVCWAVLGVVAWAALCDRFEVLTNRQDVVLPDGHPPGPSKPAPPRPAGA